MRLQLTFAVLQSSRKGDSWKLRAATADTHEHGERARRPHSHSYLKPQTVD